MKRTITIKAVEPETVAFAKKLHDQRLKTNKPLFMKAARKLHDEYIGIVLANEASWQAIREKNAKEFKEKLAVLRTHYGV